MNTEGSNGGKGKEIKGRLSHPSGYKTFHNLPARGKIGLRKQGAKKKGVNMDLAQ